jgi:membrane protein YqaA with SNARE-associated domain
METIGEFTKKVGGLNRRDKILFFGGLAVNVLMLILVAANWKDANEYVALGYIGVAVACLINGSLIISPVPAFLVVFIASKILNPFLLIAVAAVSVSIGESAKYFIGEGIDGLVSKYKWHGFLKRMFLKAPFLFLVVWISLPNPIQAIGQMFAGSVNYPFWKFALATVLGNLIWYTSVVNFGQWLFASGIVG